MAQVAHWVPDKAVQVGGACEKVRECPLGALVQRPAGHTSGTALPQCQNIGGGGGGGRGWISAARHCCGDRGEAVWWLHAPVPLPLQRCCLPAPPACGSSVPRAEQWTTAQRHRWRTAPGGRRRAERLAVRSARTPPPGPATTGTWGQGLEGGDGRPLHAAVRTLAKRSRPELGSKPARRPTGQPTASVTRRPGAAPADSATRLPSRP